MDRSWMQFTPNARLRMLVALVYVRPRIARHIYESDSAFIESEDGMVHQCVRPWYNRFHVKNCRTAGRHCGRLHIAGWRAEDVTVAVEVMEGAPDDMWRAGQVRSSVAKENTDGFARGGFEGMVHGESSLAAVEDNHIRVFAEGVGV
ncbi:hypothetical protein I7I50_12612 [Histoplasma capsulatum G186AR]|uniref:Uncharacterized protein n=1 Tax=Ajellomyces capsulatus TaxID=5037 RepID=A0A8H8CRR6_AJECA|nr:hypothetical protein I7I52_11083 [Histoplasma capsulatum]QSS70847.1 hypothetical protein I7I50_12612 [Histoplasma capsulatum G186AR]